VLSSATTLIGQPRCATPADRLVVADVRDRDDEPATRLAPDLLDAVECSIVDEPAALLGRKLRQTHELDDVAPVLAVRREGEATDARVILRQTQHVPEVLVRPAALRRPREIRELRAAAHDGAAQRLGHVRHHPRRTAVRGDDAALEDSRRRREPAMRRIQRA
jgi:hypothetical protein